MGCFGLSLLGRIFGPDWRLADSWDVLSPVHTVSQWTGGEFFTGLSVPDSDPVSHPGVIHSRKNLVKKKVG